MKVLLLIFLVSIAQAQYLEDVRITQINPTSNLGSGETYTSSWVKVRKDPALKVWCKADTSGTLYLEFSDTGTEAAGVTKSTLPSSLSVTMDANVPELVPLNKISGDFFRIQVVNGSTAQTSFGCKAYRTPTNAILTSLSNGTIQQDAPAVVTRTIGYYEAVEENKFKGVKYVGKFAENPDVDGAEDIWTLGGDYTGFPSGAAETLEVFSSSAADTSAGTGARIVRVFYLDENKNCFDSNEDFLYEDVTLNGVTGVTTTATATRVWRAKVISSGSGNKNAGNITVRHSSTTANVFAQVTAGTGQTAQSAFTVCSGYTAYLETISASMLDNTTNDVKLAIIEKLENGTEIINRPFEISTEFSKPPRRFLGVSYAEKTDLKFRALEVRNPNGDVNMSYRLRLVKN